jgi:hypothetical protein
VTCLHFNQRTRATSFFNATTFENTAHAALCVGGDCWGRRISFIAPAEMHFLYLQALRCTQTQTVDIPAMTCEFFNEPTFKIVRKRQSVEAGGMCAMFARRVQFALTLPPAAQFV